MPNEQKPTLVPLSDQDREEFPNVIYQHGTTQGLESLMVALSATKDAGLPLVMDLEFSEETGSQQATVRTSTSDRFELKTESAILHGANVVAFNELVSDTEAEQRFDQAHAIASMAVGQIYGSGDLAEGFGKYYSGLRWGTDQERFIASLFESAVEFDIDEVARVVTHGQDVTHVLYSLEDIDIPYDKRRGWSEMTPQEIFKEFPELDFEHLRNPEFLETEGGASLAEAYRKFCGYKKDKLFRAVGNNTINDDGLPLARPLIPVANFPIIEALIVDELLMAGPTAKYDLGPSEMTDIALSSDSLKAHEAIARSITTRLPEERRRVFDGPNEFEQKNFVAHQLMRAYRSSEDPALQESFRNLILEVIDAYSGDSAIATGLRQQYKDSIERGFNDLDVIQARRIVKHLLTAGLASPDAQVFLGRYMPDYEKGLATEADPLALSWVEMKEVVLDALDTVDEKSDVEYIGAIAGKVFRDVSIAERIRLIAASRKQARELTLRPEVRLARRAWSRASNFNGDNKDDARLAFEEANKHSEQKSEQASDEENSLLLDMIRSILDEAESEDHVDDEGMLEYLLKKIRLNRSLDMTELPQTYFNISQIARHPNSPMSFKSAVLWKFYESFKYAGEQSPRALIRIILDGLDLVLGDPNEELAAPADRYVSRGISALSSLAMQNKNIFKSAQGFELTELSDYKAALYRLAARVTGRQIGEGFLDELRSSSKGEGVEWQIYNVLKDFNRIEEAYKDYLHLEAVKVDPLVYYPWALRQFVPFWQGMQREVGPGNRPGRDIKELYNVLENHVSNLLVLDEMLPDDFDIVEQGSIDTLLLECYQRMVVPYDIKNNGTVWREGLSFTRYAVAMLPEAIVQKIKTKHSSKSGFIGYIDKVREEK